MSGPDAGPGGVVVLLTLRETQVLVQGFVPPASNYEGAEKQTVVVVDLTAWQPGTHLRAAVVI